jgi:hypothetical protein
MHHGVTREPMKIIYDLDSYADSRVAHGSQKELGAVVVRTKGGRTAVSNTLIHLVQK